jgi:dipeptidyl aminopeptidase/acylaminoacyl peptidase
MSAPITAPYGTWRSPFPLELLVAGGRGRREARIHAGAVYWLESRPEEGGRQALVRLHPGAEPEELTPPGMNVRSRVHEYGGGAYLVAGDQVVVSDFASGRLFRIGPGRVATPLTPDGPWRYADMVLDARRERLIAVREDHSGEWVNALATIPLDGSGRVEVLVAGHDFFAAPRLDPAGDRLAWLEWDHPNLPWDGTTLRLGTLAGPGVVDVETVAGDAGTWVTQPRWSPAGDLWFAAEPGEWINLHRWRDGRTAAICPMDAELAVPDWLFANASFEFLPDGSVLAIARSGGVDRLLRLDAEAGTAVPVDLPFTTIGRVLAEGDLVVCSVGPEDGWPGLIRVDVGTGAWTWLAHDETPVVEVAAVSRPRPFSFVSSGGRVAHAIFYPPSNPGYQAPEGERPPLIVDSHGGPTSGTSTLFSASIQAFTSRGIAFVDVDYGGSTGYGKTYRKSLEGEWGVVDVDDCVAAAQALVDRGEADPQRLAIRGGSASGFTTLAALAFRDRFGAGTSYFGIGDLEAFVGDTHKFESRYTERLVGPWPAAKALYEARSPSRHADGIRCPVLVLQGAEDRVVPPSEAEGIVAALRAGGIPHAYLLFEGEDHGFRQASSIVRSFEAELSFYGQVFGFEPAGDLPPLAIEGLAAWRQRGGRGSTGSGSEPGPAAG